MVSEYQNAILCVAKDLSGIKELELLLAKQFGDEYVIETAESSYEVLDIIKTLDEIGIETAVIISDYTIKDMSGLKLIEDVGKRYHGVKTILIAEEMNLEAIEEVVNKNIVYSLLRRPWNREQILYIIRDACKQYMIDKELESLVTKLKLSEQEKGLILDSISEAIVYVDLNKDIVWKNNMADQTLGKWEVSGPFKEVLETKNTIHVEKQFEDGTYKLIRYFPVLDKNDVPIGVVVTLLDITERVNAKKMSESLLEMSRYINVTNSIVDMYRKGYGYLQQFFDVRLMCVAGEDFDDSYIEFMDNSSTSIKHEKILFLLDSLKNILSKKEFEDFVVIKNNLGTVMAYPMGQRILMIIFSKTLDMRNSKIKFINTIAEQIKTGMNKSLNMKRILYQANHDSNTGLYNREYFMSQLEYRMEDKRALKHNSDIDSVAMMDLNYFKDINDNFSHIVGDRVLYEVGVRLRNALRNTDVIARIGGDEFAILFKHKNRREIIRLMDRLLRLIASPMVIEGSTIEVSASIGVVSNIEPYDDITHILRDADKAMYEAKKNRGGIGEYKFYEKAVQKKMERHQKIEKSLRSDNLYNELSMVYQPIVHLNDRKVAGYEGFLRWKTQDGDVYPPNEFIPIANESDEIVAIGKKVIRMALEAVEKIDEAGFNERFLDVNLTSKQLMNRSHMRMVKNTAIKGKLPSNRIKFDIKDNFKESQLSDVCEYVRELHDFGIGVNLDDFGTGSSSLSILSDMDVEDIKIDASLVHKIRHNEKALRMVKAIISLAKSLNTEVTAEGVEKKEELDILESLGCDNAQGFYFSKPMILEEAINYKAV